MQPITLENNLLYQIKKEGLEQTTKLSHFFRLAQMINMTNIEIKNIYIKRLKLFVASIVEQSQFHTQNFDTIKKEIITKLFNLNLKATINLQDRKIIHFYEKVKICKNLLRLSIIFTFSVVQNINFNTISLKEGIGILFLLQINKFFLDLFEKMKKELKNETSRARDEYETWLTNIGNPNRVNDIEKDSRALQILNEGLLVNQDF